MKERKKAGLQACPQGPSVHQALRRTQRIRSKAPGNGGFRFTCRHAPATHPRRRQPVSTADPWVWHSARATSSSLAARWPPPASSISARRRAPPPATTTIPPPPAQPPHPSSQRRPQRLLLPQPARPRRALPLLRRPSSSPWDRCETFPADGGHVPGVPLHSREFGRDPGAERYGARQPPHRRQRFPRTKRRPPKPPRRPPRRRSRRPSRPPRPPWMATPPALPADWPAPENPFHAPPPHND